MAIVQFTPEEVAKHNKPSDCWVIVRGQVYNVTQWVPRHPGGPLIYVHAGSDCTQLFDSYHPLSARKVLEKYLIGEVHQQGQAVLAYKDGTDFYTVLRDRVDQYFKTAQLHPRETTGMYVKSAAIFAGIVAFFLGAFFWQTELMAGPLLCSALLGVCMAEVGVSIMHDANHGAYSSNKVLCWLMSASLDAVGASSFMWRQQHVVGHHAFTNLEGVDPDIRVKQEGDVRRVTSRQPWMSYHRYQHLYLGALYGLLSLKSVLVDDFSAWSSGFIGAVRLQRMTWDEAVIFWGGKLVFAAWYILVPVVWSHHSVSELLMLWLLSQLCVGWMLAFMFQVAHVTEDVAFLKHDANSGLVDMGWAEAQVATTADFCHGSWFWTHISGGLNYQVVHHLFPGVNHLHYPALAPIVQQTCKQFNLRYVVYPTFWSALRAHFGHLRKVGAGAVFSVPSLATVG